MKVKKIFLIVLLLASSLVDGLTIDKKKIPDLEFRVEDFLIKNNHSKNKALVQGIIIKKGQSYQLQVEKVWGENFSGQKYVEIILPPHQIESVSRVNTTYRILCNEDCGIKEGNRILFVMPLSVKTPIDLSEIHALKVVKRKTGEDSEIVLTKEILMRFEKLFGKPKSIN